MAVSTQHGASVSLAFLLDGLAATQVPEIAIADVTMDSRQAVPGSLFLACAGGQVHGLDFVDQAIAGGAVAVAWDGALAPSVDVPCVHVPGLASLVSAIAGRFYGEPSHQLLVTGITGTDGKTSCAWMLAQALERLGHRCGYIGTLGLGRTNDLAQASHTTPNPVQVQRVLARFVEQGIDSVAFEVSSHALDQHRVDGVVFDSALLTQVGRDHLDYHGDEATYAAAKQRLFTLPGLRKAVINTDDAHGRAWLEGLDESISAVVYGHGHLPTTRGGQVRIENVELHADGLVLDVDTHAGTARIESVLVGAFNAMNLAAVLAVLLARGESLADCVAVLSMIETVPGRMQRIPGRADQPLVVVDYAHTPGALTVALAAVRAHAAERVLCVFGCGGDRDRGKRPLMGRAAIDGADAVWVTDDNPRSESPEAIVSEILAGMGHAARVRVEHDRARAIVAAIGEATRGDVVLIAGKGHEITQQIGTEHRAFDDRIVAQRALEAA